MVAWRTVLEVFRLARLAAAYGVVSNVVFVVLWGRARASAQGSTAGHAPELFDTPLWVLLGGGTLQALGLFAFAITLNDILDLHRDRALRVDRPLATGALSAEAAAALISGTLIAAVMGSTVFGIAGVVMTVALAGGALAYNAAARFVPALGIPLLSALYAGHLLVPDWPTSFLWPVWLVFTHLIIVQLGAMLAGRRGIRLSVRGAAMVLAAWLVASATLAGVSTYRNAGLVWPQDVMPASAIAVAALLCGFALMTWRVTRSRTGGTRSEERVQRYGALWMPLYNAAWLFGNGHTGEGAVMLAIAAAGPVLIGVMRELYGLVEHPLGYRL